MDDSQCRILCRPLRFTPRRSETRELGRALGAIIQRVDVFDSPPDQSSTFNLQERSPMGRTWNLLYVLAARTLGLVSL